MTKDCPDCGMPAEKIKVLGFFCEHKRCPMMSDQKNDLCQCPICGRMHKGLGFGNPPAAIAGKSLLRAPEKLRPAPIFMPDCIMSRDGKACKGYTHLRNAAISELRERLSLRFNNHLIEMKEGYDDSIVGFNEAWTIANHLLDEMERAFSAPARG